MFYFHPYLGRRFPFWLICFRWVGSTTQLPWCKNRTTPGSFGVWSGGTTCWNGAWSGWRARRTGVSACRNRKINMVSEFWVFMFDSQIISSKILQFALLIEMKSKWKFLEPILGIVRSRPQMNEFIEWMQCIRGGMCHVHHRALENILN